MSLTKYIELAFTLLATTYGYGEKMCGDVGHAVRCRSGIPTASGIPFDTSRPQLAVAAPAILRMERREAWIRLDQPGAPCVHVEIVDKMAERWIGLRGFDLNPAALRLLMPDGAGPEWSGRVRRCIPPYPLLIWSEP